MDLASLLPKTLQDLDDPQTALPRIAKDRKLTALIESIIKEVPTHHDLRLGDSRNLQAEGVQLVLTSPPYWTLKEYRKSDGQLGFVADYEVFLGELDKVWERCHKALVPGGRLICVVGDVCLSRRNNGGRHMVMPLHSSIQEHCRQIGFDNLAPIIWHKIANANTGTAIIFPAGPAKSSFRVALTSAGESQPNTGRLGKRCRVILPRHPRFAGRHPSD